MILAVVNLLAAIAALVSPFAPTLLDKDGLGLRIHRLTIQGSYIAGETLERIGFDILVLNFSDATIEHDTLGAARAVGDLDLRIVAPDGNPLRRLGRPGRRDPFTQQMRLRPGEFESAAFRFNEFGYGAIRQLGRYRIECTLKLGSKTITAPPLQFEVIDIPQADVLFSHTVPLEGREAKLPAGEQSRPFVQQVKVGGRTLLVYRRWYGLKWGGLIETTSRLAELPGKAEMTVAGAFGDWNPLTISYKDPNSKTGITKLVINSINGLPWTEEEERLRIERNKKREKSAPPPIKP
jgi:hypothetical protein